MKGNFPFTDYDFWAYISSGLIFLFAVDHVAQFNLMLRSDWTVIEGFIALALAYAVGQILAGLASAIVERWIVRELIGSPSLILFNKTSTHPLQKFYPSFFEALPLQTQNIILQKASRSQIDTPGEALFWLAFHETKANEISMLRMASFLNQYGLCRNLSLTLSFCFALLVSNAAINNASADYGWALAALCLSVGMFFRYLKFYRHYALEVYTTYAHAK